MISFTDKNNKTHLKILNMILFWKTILTILILINYNSLINLVFLIIKKLKIIKKIKVFFYDQFKNIKLGLIGLNYLKFILNFS